MADGDRRAALWLAGATIRGTIRLVNGFVAEGGVSLDAARVHGDVRVERAYLKAGEPDAFNVRDGIIEGVMFIRRSLIDGVVWMLGLRTGGYLEFSDTTIIGHVDPWDVPNLPPARRREPHRHRKALVLMDADIGASLRIDHGFVAFGSVNFAAAKIRGNLDATGARIANKTRDGLSRAVDGTNSEIGANLLLDGVETSGRVDIAGARIGGKLSFLAANMSNPTSAGDGQALEAINVSVGGNAEFGRASTDGSTGLSLWTGIINLVGARIGGDLAFANALVDNLRPDGAGEAILARRVNVHGSFTLDGGCIVRGVVLLSGATIGRDLLCRKATLHNPKRSALYAKDVEIGDDLTLEGCGIRGDVRLERAAITGSVALLQPCLEGGRHRQLELIHSRIGARLRFDRIPHISPYGIDLTGARVGTIEVTVAYGPTLAEPTDYPLGLDGLVYDRIEHTPQLHYSRDRRLRRAAHIPTGGRAWLGPCRDHIADPLIDWLLRHRSVSLPGHRRFHPQPFRQLAAVLRAQGNDEAARTVAIAERFATPRAFGTRTTHRLFGVCFGFGFLPLRALFVLSLWVAVGTIGTNLALKHDLMIETPHSAATSFMPRAHRPPIRAYVPDDAPDASGKSADEPPENERFPQELACFDLEGWLDSAVYAFDTMVPFIPLKQEEKCEFATDAHWLRFCRAVYTVVGWVITSLTLLTLSGIIKRFDGEGGG
jgi:hypothetical protein